MYSLIEKYIAADTLSDKKLYVYNMSSGTDVTDLIGGFKPIDCRLLLKDLFYEFL